MTFSVHICKNEDVQEAPREEPAIAGFTVRDAVMGLWGVCNFAKHPATRKGFQKLRDLDFLCYYGTRVVWSRKKRTSMDVQKLVAEWKKVVVILCSAHDKDEIDKAEFKMDELLSPMLTAPVKELREFYEQLTKELREDKSVPFFIWTMFNKWGKGIVDTAEDKPAAKRLRKKLANEIAEMAEEHVRGDIAEAMAGALMWRDPETLKAIKRDLQEGAKPALKGRESCLFLVTKGPSGEHTVML